MFTYLFCVNLVLNLMFDFFKLNSSHVHKQVRFHSHFIQGGIWINQFFAWNPKTNRIQRVSTAETLQELLAIQAQGPRPASSSTQILLPPKSRCLGGRTLGKYKNLWEFSFSRSVSAVDLLPYFISAISGVSLCYSSVSWSSSMFTVIVAVCHWRMQPLNRDPLVDVL